MSTQQSDVPSRSLARQQHAQRVPTKYKNSRKGRGRSVRGHTFVDAQRTRCRHERWREQQTHSIQRQAKDETGEETDATSDSSCAKHLGLGRDGGRTGQARRYGWALPVPQARRLQQPARIRLLRCANLQQAAGGMFVWAK